MPAFQPRSLRRSTADECWFSPVIKYAVPTSRESDASDNDISNTGNDGDDHDTASMVMVAMPPAHDQLLSGDHPSSEALQGHDHAQVDLVDNLDCYIGDGCRQKLSVVKQLGGGSWLLGSVAHLSLSAQKRQPCKIEVARTASAVTPYLFVSKNIFPLSIFFELFCRNAFLQQEFSP